MNFLTQRDLHRPTLTQQLGVYSGPGLAECLTTQLAPFDVIRRIEPLSWYLLPAGRPLEDASEVLQTENLPRLLEKLGPSFDWIVIDSPPLVPLTDTLSLAKTAAASLLVARAGRTPRRAIDEAIALLGSTHVCGIILNGIDLAADSYAGYGYYYTR